MYDLFTTTHQSPATKALFVQGKGIKMMEDGEGKDYTHQERTAGLKKSTELGFPILCILQLSIFSNKCAMNHFN